MENNTISALKKVPEKWINFGTFFNIKDADACVLEKWRIRKKIQLKKQTNTWLYSSSIEWDQKICDCFLRSEFVELTRMCVTLTFYKVKLYS